MEILANIFKISAPMIFAVTGVLITEYAGVLAVFMEGAITFSAFLYVLFTILTGSHILGFISAVVITQITIGISAIFTMKTKANPFLTGLAINLFYAGMIPFLSSFFLNKNGVITFDEFLPLQEFKPINNLLPFIISVFLLILLTIFLKFTVYGFNLKYCSEAEEFLIINGNNPDKYKIFSWSAASFFAVCSGVTLASRLTSYTPNISSGIGWIALAAVFSGRKQPVFCFIAVLVFAAAEHFANTLQGIGQIPAGFLLSLPYLLSLILLVFSPLINLKKIKNN